MKRIKKKPTYNLNEEQIRRIKEDAVKEAVDLALIKTMYISLMVLRDHYGYGKSRLTTFIDHVLDMIDSVNQDYLTIGDMEKVIEQETGVTFRQRDDGRLF